MKKKLVTLFIGMVCILINLVGCQDKEYTKEEIYEEFKEKVSKIESYTCTSEVEVLGNKGKSSYTLKQAYNKSNGYRIEFISPTQLKGNVVEYRDGKVIIKKTNIDDSIELPNNEKDYIFIGEFINNYLNDKDVVINSSKEYVTLESKIIEGKDYFDKQILYINKDRELPEKMEILDKEGTVRITVKYNDIEYKK
ncbi:MAG: germination lipoprotein GerS [Peptostreptococcaceae bacterium]